MATFEWFSVRPVGLTFVRVSAYNSGCMRFALGPALLLCLSASIPAQQAAKPPDVPASHARFTDVTSALGVHFQYIASHTAKHYLIETMGAGVALFDYDNDGRLDIFLAN